MTANGLKEDDAGLYELVRKRKLLSKIALNPKRMKWKHMPDEELLAYAQRFIETNALKSPKGLLVVARGLYETLANRGLSDRLTFEKKRNMRNWAAMSDEKLMEYAESFIRAKGIAGRRELDEQDQGLHEVLRRRGLLEILFPATSDQELLAQLATAVDAYAEQ